jgi:hypothetical protein
MKIIFTNNIHALSLKLPYYAPIGSKSVIISGYLPTNIHIPNIHVVKKNYIDTDNLLIFLSENIDLVLDYMYEKIEGDNMWTGGLVAHIHELARVIEHVDLNEREVIEKSITYPLCDYIFSIYEALSSNFTEVTKNIRSTSIITDTPGVIPHRHGIEITSIAKEQLFFLFMVVDDIRESMEKELIIKTKKYNTVSKLSKEQTWIYVINEKSSISEPLKRKAHNLLLSLFNKHNVKEVTLINTINKGMILDMNDSIEYAFRGIDFEVEESYLT